MTKSSTVVSAEQARQALPEFPLFAHATRRWAKKFRRSTTASARGRSARCLEKYVQDPTALHAGLIPTDPSTEIGPNVADLRGSSCSQKTSSVIARDRRAYAK